MIVVRVDPNLHPKFCQRLSLDPDTDAPEERVVLCKRNQICMPTRCQTSLPDSASGRSERKLLFDWKHLTSGKKSDDVCRDVVDETGFGSTFTSGRRVGGFFTT